MSLIRTLLLTDKINIKVCQGSHGIYYYLEFDNPTEQEKLFPVYYDIHFPLNWVINQKEIDTYDGRLLFTGPQEHGCDNCKYYGYYNGVFMGYCLNCANVFECKRGNGMTDLGIELEEDMVAFDLTYFKKENSMWNTYLKDVSLDNIGDTKLYEDFEMYKDLPDLIENKVVEEKEQQEKEQQEDEEYNNYDEQFPEEEENDYDYEEEEDKEDRRERQSKSFKDKYLEDYEYAYDSDE